MTHTVSEEPADAPISETLATKLLAKNLKRVQKTRNLSQGEIARMLGYKTAVALSHMASGRVPIPINRAVDFANFFGIDQKAFVLAVLEQRHPEIDFRSLFNATLFVDIDNATDMDQADSTFATQLRSIAGMPLDNLPKRTQQILGEVVAARNPERRWVSVDEVSRLEEMRQHGPRQ